MKPSYRRIEDFFDQASLEIIEPLFDYCFRRLGPEKAMKRVNELMSALVVEKEENENGR